MLTKRLAYEQWLGIKEEHQPASLYRLVGVDEFESNTKTIADAAMRRVDALRQLQNGDDAKLATEILNELVRAQIILLNPEEKAAYDTRLRDSAWFNPAIEAHEAHPVPLLPSRDLPASAPAGAAERTRQPSGQSPPLEAIPVAKLVPQARLVQTAAANGPRAPGHLDLDALISDAAHSSHKQRAKSRKQLNRIAVGAAIALAAVGCAAAGLFFLFEARQGSKRDDGGNAASNDRPKPPEPSPSKSDLAKDSGGHGLAGDGIPAKTGTASTRKTQNNGEAPVVIRLPQAPPRPPPAPPYDEVRLANDVREIGGLAQSIKTPDESQHLARKAIVLADRAIVLGNAETAKRVAVLGLAAARSGGSIPLSRQITVTLIQLQSPTSDVLLQLAKKRLASSDAGRPDGLGGEPAPRGPSLVADNDAARRAEASVHHEARWGKTEAERRKIFYDLLQAVDDFGVTPEGRKAWKEILARNGIDARATLGILNEGFSTFSDWEQPGGSGTASSRMNRMHWIAQRTRGMSEPMLED